MRKIFGSTLLMLVGAAQAQTPAIRNYCAATPEERMVADATALLIQKTSLIDNLDGTYRINTTAHTGDSAPLCTTDPFYGMHYVPNGRTAFVVGSDGIKMMLTAPHGPGLTGLNPSNYAVVFGLHHTLSGGVCSPPNFSSIPAANVYFPPSLSMLRNTYSSASPRPADYMLFQLDRQPTAPALKLRRSGGPEVGDPLLVVGHYGHFPTLIGSGVTVRAVTPLGLDIGSPPIGQGSSGSPVYNLRTKLVETVIADAMPGFEEVQASGSTCATTEPANVQEIRVVNNGKLSELVDSGVLPPEPFVVSPTASVLHTATVGGTVSNRFTQFTVTPIPGSGTADSYAIGQSLPISYDPQKSPTLEISPSSTFTPTPGSPAITFTAGASIAGVPCGVYDTDLKIVRNSPSQQGKPIAVIPHRFEIGVHDFTASPQEAWTPSGFGPSFKQQQVLTLTNTRATPVSLAVTADQSWLKINGAASATIALTAAGSSGASATATLSIADSAGGGSGAVASKAAKVKIQSTEPQCDLRAPTTVDVALTTGRASRIAYLDDASMNGGTPFGPVVEVPLDFSSATMPPPVSYSVADIDLELGFFADENVSWPIQDTDDMLKVELVAPDNTTAVLWQAQNASSAYFGSTTRPYGNGILALSTFKLNATTAPPAPGSFSTFTGLAAAGVWKVRLYSTQNGVLPMKVQLNIRRN